MDLTQYNNPNLPDEPSEGGKMPDGRYGAECIGFKKGEYRSGGDYIEFEYVILGPTHAGKHIWQKTTLNHPDADRRKYGQLDRRKIGKAIGLPEPGDLTNCEQAVGKSVTLTLKTKGEYQNVVGVSSYGSHSGPPPAAGTMQQQAMPWEASQAPQPGKYAAEAF